MMLMLLGDDYFSGHFLFASFMASSIGMYPSSDIKNSLNCSLTGFLHIIHLLLFIKF